MGETMGAGEGKTMTFLMTVFLLVSAQADTKILKYPQLYHISGSAEVQSATDMKYRKPKVKEIYRDRALIRTSPTGSMEILLDDHRRMTILPDTQVYIPHITWETGEVGNIVIQTGEVFFQQTSDYGKSIRIKSELFDIETPVGQYKLSYYPHRATAEAKVFSGTMEFSALNSETSAQVTAGKKVVFEGVREDGEIAFDILLKGRRIPKGSLRKLEDIDKAEMNAYTNEELDKKRKADLKKLADEKAKKEAMAPGVLCKNPFAKLNECAWICLKNRKGAKGKCLTQMEGVSCVRRRCNLNGVWAEESVLEASEGAIKCQATAQVAPCDY
jgi:hypothetical protein